MSSKRNGIFSGVVPVMGKFQTVVPLAAGSRVLTQAISQSLAETNPTTRHSTGSILLDSFIGDATSDAFALQTQLTSLSFELKRIANPNIRRVSPRDKQAAKPLEKRLVNRQTDANSVPNRQVAKPINDRRPIPTAPKQVSTGEAQAIGAQIARAQAEKAQIERVRIKSTRVSSASPVKSAPSEKANAPSRLPLPIPPAVSKKKVYGGADYKALQSRAQAGGLVNLDDWLLFGGADSDPSASHSSAKQPQLDSFSSYLSERLQDFTASPIPGGFHATAHVMKSSLAGKRQHRTVLGIKDFKLGNLTSDEVAADVPISSTVQGAISTDKPVALDDLSKQVVYLNQQIEYLSQKLAALSKNDARGDRATESSKAKEAAAENKERSHSPIKGQTKEWSPTVLSTEVSTFGESTRLPDERVATLESLSKAL